ncbi:hypothetical protein DIS24_g10294 [Lasiodiplodia hormozganensis]|uniref:Uncharacterized protein n=1 Tax=Lasiodiplodia hormozganensis TaxID=869390 RepID=A0AA39XPS8_9PEZI|nr:hypothetical protein DIS24_g10294 [Lasiodiplodia hormozganensis]
MPTNANRPFLSNFLAAFRAQSAFQSAAPSPTSQSPSTTTASAKPATQSYTTSSTTYDPSSRPTGATKPNAASNSTAAGANTTTTTTQTSFSPYGKAPSTPGTPPQTSGGYNYNNGYPIPPSSSSPSRHRRGSDSSSDGGFRERTGSAGANGGNAMPEKWYIGGRTPGGEERFYKLGMVRRMRSSDRLSLDRLSL